MAESLKMIHKLFSESTLFFVLYKFLILFIIIFINFYDLLTLTDLTISLLIPQAVDNIYL